MYFNRISGLVYGNNPRQGYVETHWFYHPDLAFAFSIPLNWKVENTPKQVILSSKESNAAIVLQVETSALNLQEYMKKKSANITNARLLSSKSLLVHGLSTLKGLFHVAQDQGEAIGAQITCIRKDRLIFTFLSFSPVSTFNRYLPVFNQTNDSFQRLKNPRHLNRKPLRIYLAKADGRMSLKRILATHRIPGRLWQKIGLLNGLELDSIPRRYQTLKLLK
jgi:predicted Zn-dependent protease